MERANTEAELPVVYPIINFEAKLDLPFEISPTMVIRELSKQEQKELLNILTPIEITHPRRPKYCLDFKSNKKIEENSGTPYQVISVLRLLKPKLVGINHVIFQEVSSKVYRYPSSMEADTSLSRIFKGLYVFEEAERSVFLNLLAKVRERLTDKLDKKLRFALGRFNMSYCSKTVDDMLLNYIFALESLYLSGISEKKFRLCCYVTFALSSNSDDPKEIWNYIDSAYNLRSQIVHGQGLRHTTITVGKGYEKTKISPKDFTDKIEEYTRKSILRVLEETSVKEFQNKLQKELIERLGAIYEHGSDQPT
ncbi:MAG: HEPN domain-containing protein [Candidatus Bathyarchaeota archaeon]|jgi:hypothetical protein